MILAVVKIEINSNVVEGLNNKIRRSFKRSYGFKAQEIRRYDHTSGIRRIEVIYRMLKRSDIIIWMLDALASRPFILRFI